MPKTETRKIITVTPKDHAKIKKYAVDKGTFLQAATDKIIAAGLKALETKKVRP